MRWMGRDREEFACFEARFVRICGDDGTYCFSSVGTCAGLECANGMRVDGGNRVECRKRVKGRNRISHGPDNPGIRLSCTLA